MSSSENNLCNSCWGQPTWFALHSITFGFPLNGVSVETATSYKLFFESLQNVLPCSGCRSNLKKNMEKLPIDSYLSGRRDLTYWLYLIHNMVNDEIGVSVKNTPTFEEVCKKYEGFRGECDDASTKTCGGDKCKMIIKNAKEPINAIPNVFNSHWPLIIIIIGLLIAIAVMNVKNNK